jgi:hypothetical protein
VAVFVRVANADWLKEVLLDDDGVTEWEREKLLDTVGGEVADSDAVLVLLHVGVLEMLGLD